MKCFAGIDLGGTNIKGGLVNSDNEILYTKSIKTMPERGFEAVAQDIANLLIDMTLESGIKMQDVEYIGIGSPGAIDSKRGVVYFAGNLGWENAHLGEYIAQKLNKQVYVGNDANCAALGEYLTGAQNKYESMAMITIGTGVGFGLILNNKVYSGATYGGGEFGHTTLILDGENCTCGKKGCLEAYASFSALLRDTGRFIKENPHSLLAKIEQEKGEIEGKDIFEAAINGNSDAINITDRFLKYIGAGVVNIINILDPAVIVIGGGISKSADYFLPKIKKYAENNAFCKQVPLPEIIVASSGNDVGIIGAARLGEYK
ncbi:MAG: ROK family protein [Proteocatella sp.]